MASLRHRVLVGVIFAVTQDVHVRVDVLRERWSPELRAWIEIYGILLLLLPFIVLVLVASWPFVTYSFTTSEISQAPGGLALRWVIKSVLPLGFLLLALATVARLAKVGRHLFGARKSRNTLARSNRGVTVSAGDWLSVAMFISFIVLIFTGFPVAWVLGGLAVVFTAIGIIAEIDFGWPVTMSWEYSALVVDRIWDVMNNWVLVALPMFILMGIMLEKSGLAGRLLENLATLLERVPGGLAISVTTIGVLLAASTGIIGASVVLLGLLALPSMLRQGYQAEFATGTVAAVGTLGILIPPSIMLVLMADRLAISVGDLFLGALLPGLLLSALYIAFIVTNASLRPGVAPAVSRSTDHP